MSSTPPILMDAPPVVDAASTAPEGHAETAAKIPIRLMVLSDAVPDRNGVGTYYNDLLKHLEEHIETADMIPAGANCLFRRSGVSMPVFGDKTQRFYFPNITRILKHYREVKPQVLIAPSMGPFTALAVAMTRCSSKVKLIAGFHTAYIDLADMYYRGPKRRLYMWILKHSHRLFFNTASLAVVNTEFMAEEARKFGADKITCVGTTLAKEFIDKPLQPYPGAVKKVLFAGRLAPEKNIYTLVEAAREMPDLQFNLAGEGPERKRLEQLTRNIPNLNLLGWLDRETLLEQVDQTDLLVLPSYLESFGSIALEGMARGRLVLISEACGILAWPELADALFTIRQDESVASALRRVRNLPERELQACGRRAREATCRMNGRAVQQWIDLLQEVSEPRLPA